MFVNYNWNIKRLLQCLFLTAFEKKAVVLQSFVEQLAILITHHIPAQKSCLMQQKTAHNQTFLHKVRVVNHSINPLLLTSYFVVLAKFCTDLVITYLSQNM